MPIKFGTDGWRAIIADQYTYDNVRLCAQGTADMLKAQGLASKGFFVGYDTRFSSEHFAAAVAEVAAGNGIKTYLADRSAPTPTISYNLVARKGGGGAIITASHNPGTYNGYKYKPDYGGSASPEVVAELERYIADAEKSGSVRRMDIKEAKSKGLVEEFDPEPLYLENMAKLVDLKAIRNAGLTIAVDSMYGTGAGYFAKLLGGGSTRVVEIHAERNPAFPGMAQPEPLAHNLGGLKKTALDQEVDVALATDGDADRLGVMDQYGRFITTLQTFALLCYHQLEVLANQGAMVRSITMTSMVDKLGYLYNAPVFDTAVGFKYLGQVMMREDAMIAGEESGGYAFRGNIPERDGILSGLMLLDLLVKTKKTIPELLKDLEEKVGPHHYDRLDLKFDEKDREAIKARVEKARPTTLGGRQVKDIDTRDGYRFVLVDGYWALIRFSGTEPLLRIYAEGESVPEVDLLLEEARRIAGV